MNQEALYQRIKQAGGDDSSSSGSSAGRLVGGGAAGLGLGALGGLGIGSRYMRAVDDGRERFETRSRKALDKATQAIDKSPDPQKALRQLDRVEKRIFENDARLNKMMDKAILKRRGLAAKAGLASGIGGAALAALLPKIREKTSALRDAVKFDKSESDLQRDRRAFDRGTGGAVLGGLAGSGAALARYGPSVMPRQAALASMLGAGAGALSTSLPFYTRNKRESEKEVRLPRTLAAGIAGGALGGVGGLLTVPKNRAALRKAIQLKRTQPRSKEFEISENLRSMIENEAGSNAHSRGVGAGVLGGIGAASIPALKARLKKDEQD